VNDNLGLAYQIADASKERRIDLDDRRQAACVGLIRAVQGWKPDKGALSTYATRWIKQAIQRAAAKASPLVSLDDFDGFEPIDATEPAGIDPDDAERLRAVVVGLPDEARRAMIDRFFKGGPKRRGRAGEIEDAALHLMRKATDHGKAIPAVAPWWSDHRTGEPIRPRRLDDDDAKALAGLRLLPIFPAVGFAPGSPCPHDGPLPAGSREVCMTCSRSGVDGIKLPRPEDVKPLPVDRPKPPPKPTKGESRKERRARERGKLKKAG